MLILREQFLGVKGEVRKESEQEPMSSLGKFFRPEVHPFYKPIGKIMGRRPGQATDLSCQRAKPTLLTGLQHTPVASRKTQHLPLLLHTTKFLL